MRDEGVRRVEGGQMKVRDLVLLLVSLGEGRPEFGRTSLQKLGYFAGLTLDRDLGYQPHYYGPFSTLIERETQALVLSNLLEERTVRLGFANRAGFAARQYEYSGTAPGKERLADLHQRYPEEVKQLESLVTSLVGHVGRLDQQILSAAAKVDYIARQEGRPVTIQDVRTAATELGWELGGDQIEKVVELLRSLGFVDTIEDR